MISSSRRPVSGVSSKHHCCLSRGWPLRLPAPRAQCDGPDIPCSRNGKYHCLNRRIGPAPLDSGRAPVQQCTVRQHPARWRRPTDHRPRPPGPGPAGRLWRLRRLGPGRGRRQAHLLRPLRPAAPRPGVGRHRGQQRPPDPGLQGHGPGLAGLRRVDARVAQGPPRDRPRALLDDRRQHLAQRPADLPPHRGRLDRAGPQRQPDQHRRAGHRWSPTWPRSTASSTSSVRRPRRPPTTPAWSPRCSPTTPTAPSRSRRWSCCPKVQGAFSFVWMDEDTLYAARDPQGIRPLVLGRLERGWVVASETAALDIVGASFIREVEPGEMVAVDEDGLRTPHVRRAGAQGLPVRVRLPRPPRHPDLRPAGAQRPRRDRPPAGPGLPGRRRPGHPGAGVRHPGRDRVRRGVRHPLRHGPGQELLRRPHVHPAEPDDPPARHPAQAQPAARRHRGQAARRRRRLDRARQHPARAGPDAPRGRRPRGARADLLARR